ncbi:OpgC family protein [Rhodovastum atsumiense]|nr:OpgC domain-containing protein [Rhodovastum atsumiense]
MTRFARSPGDGRVRPAREGQGRSGGGRADPAPAGASRRGSGERDYRLDFFRGLALVFIFMDHIPDNIPSYFTLRSFALSDAAEVFIFISGYTAALVYGRALMREGALMAGAHVWRRTWQLYVAHLCMFMLFNAQVSFTLQHFNNPLFAEELGIGAYLDQPEEAILRVLLLQLQPSFLNILPLYIALLAAFPLVLVALRAHPLLALLPSAALWAVVQVWDVNLPGYPEAREWYFNPLAWQFLFVIAATFGFRRALGQEPVRWPRWLLPAAAGFLVVGGVVQMATMLHAILGAPTGFLVLPLWAVDKTPLPPLRLISMLALAYLVAMLVPRDSRFMISRPGWLLVLCGQQSLYVFCLSILLSVLGNMVLTMFGGRLGLQILVNLAGIVALIGFGLLLSWYSGGGRLPVRPRPPPAGGAA